MRPQTLVSMLSGPVRAPLQRVYWFVESVRSQLYKIMKIVFPVFHSKMCTHFMFLAAAERKSFHNTSCRSFLCHQIRTKEIPVEF